MLYVLYMSILYIYILDMLFSDTNIMHQHTYKPRVVYPLAHTVIFAHVSAL